MQNKRFNLTILFVIAAAIVIAASGYFFAKDDLLENPKKQLEAINRDDDLEAYAKYTSKEFQEVTSLPSFRAFLDLYPFFRKDPKLQLEVVKKTDHEATLKGDLVLPKGQAVAVEYKLIKEQGDWKIQTITVLDETNSVADRDSLEQLRKPIDTQLNALQNSKVSKSYYDAVTEDFQQRTPYWRYEKIVKETPMLSTHKKREIVNHSINGNEGRVDIKLYANMTEMPIEYGLRRVNGEWKIWSMRLIKPAPESVTTEVQPLHLDNLIAALDAQEVPPSVPPPVPSSAPAAPAPSAEDNEGIKNTIEQHLQMLKSGNVEATYEASMSQGFKHANTLQVFKDFVQRYPILTTGQAKYSTPSFQSSYGTEIVDIAGPDATAHVNYLLMKESGVWKILAININYETVPTQVPQPKQEPVNYTAQPEVAKPTEDPTEIIIPVQQLLTSLGHSDFSAAYKYYMSEGFQKGTSYDEFKKIMQRLPAIMQGTVTFSKPKIEADHGFVSATSTSPYGTATLDFTLVLEHRAWKIHVLNISGTTIPTPSTKGTPVTEKPTPLPPENLNPSAIEYPIQLQIFLDSTGEISRSYFELTSQAFQRSTNLQEFTDFVKGNSVFVDNANYKIEDQSNGVDSASFKVSMSSNSKETATVLYDLVRENNKWKIQNIQILDNSSPPRGLSKAHHTELLAEEKEEPVKQEENLTSPAALIRLAPIPQHSKEETVHPEHNEKSNLSITYGVFGTKVNEAGFVQVPTLSIPKGKDSIYFNLFVEDAKKGDKLNLSFKHLNSGTVIPDITSRIRTDGNSTLSFIFAPPPQGWPEGIYEVTVSASNGEVKPFSFRVE